MSNVEYRSKVFYHLFFLNKTERSDAILRHSEFLTLDHVFSVIRYSIFLVCKLRCSTDNPQ